MAGTVHVTLAGPAVSSELVSAFSARGLAVAVSEGRECSELEVSYAADPDERLRSDVKCALRDWLAEAHTPLVLSEAGDRDYVLRPAGE
jgi:hypothetical protein